MAFPFRSRSTNIVVKIGSLIFAATAAITTFTILSPGKAADAAGNPKKGMAVFSKNSCVVCHPGGENTMDPGHPIKGSAFQTKYKNDLILENTIRKGFAQSGMPSFSKTIINENDMKDLIAYVRSLSKTVNGSK